MKKRWSIFCFFLSPFQEAHRQYRKCVHLVRRQANFPRMVSEFICASVFRGSRQCFLGHCGSNQSSSCAPQPTPFLFCPFLCLLCTNYSIIELQLVWKGFKFIFSTDVLPSNTAVIVGLVHLSFRRSILVLTVKRPAGVKGCVCGLSCLCRSLPFDLNAPRHTHHSLNISYEVFSNIITRITALSSIPMAAGSCVFCHVLPT